MAKTASNQAIAIPAKGAIKRPAALFCVRDAITPDIKAPASNCPSIAILITPDRSESTPAIAPKISGTDKKSAPCSRPVNGMNFPAAAQQRNDIRNDVPKIALAARMVLRARNCSAAITTASSAMTAKRSAPDFELTIISLAMTHSLPSTKL